jgi:hypothetical protein
MRWLRDRRDPDERKARIKFTFLFFPKCLPINDLGGEKEWRWWESAHIRLRRRSFRWVEECWVEG